MRLPAAFLLLIAGSAAASPRESTVFSNINSNGVLNSAANSVQMRTFVGGYALGRIDITGTLTSVHPNTWRSDTRIVVTSPGGASAVFQAFPTGGTYTTLTVNGSMFLPAGTGAAGDWTFRFFESFDDGGAGAIDARWNITVTLTDEQLSPPAATDFGTLQAPGAAATAPLTEGQVRWFRFTVPADVPGAGGLYLDVDTFGTNLPAAGANTFVNDTLIGLYTAGGARVAQDDDSCDGFMSQFSFGAGTRPPQGDGVPYDGRDGPLAAGTYYLAVASYPATFGALRWETFSQGTQTGTVAVRLRTNAGAPCYANCDSSTTPPVLNVADFGCFLTRYAAGDPSANCDGSTSPPVLNVADFGCFLTKYAAGCP